MTPCPFDPVYLFFAMIFAGLILSLVPMMAMTTALRRKEKKIRDLTQQVDKLVRRQARFDAARHVLHSKKP